MIYTKNMFRLLTLSFSFCLITFQLACTTHTPYDFKPSFESLSRDPDSKQPITEELDNYCIDPKVNIVSVDHEKFFKKYFKECGFLQFKLPGGHIFSNSGAVLLSSGYIISPEGNLLLKNGLLLAPNGNVYKRIDLLDPKSGNDPRFKTIHIFDILKKTRDKKKIKSLFYQYHAQFFTGRDFCSLEDFEMPMQRGLQKEVFQLDELTDPDYTNDSYYSFKYQDESNWLLKNNDVLLNVPDCEQSAAMIINETRGYCVLKNNAIVFFDGQVLLPSGAFIDHTGTLCTFVKNEYQFVLNDDEYNCDEKKFREFCFVAKQKFDAFTLACQRSKDIIQSQERIDRNYLTLKFYKEKARILDKLKIASTGNSKTKKPQVATKESRNDRQASQKGNQKEKSYKGSSSTDKEKQLNNDESLLNAFQEEYISREKEQAFKRELDDFLAKSLHEVIDDLQMCFETKDIFCSIFINSEWLKYYLDNGTTVLKDPTVFEKFKSNFLYETNNQMNTLLLFNEAFSVQDFWRTFWARGLQSTIISFFSEKKEKKVYDEGEMNEFFKGTGRELLIACFKEVSSYSKFPEYLKESFFVNITLISSPYLNYYSLDDFKEKPFIPSAKIGEIYKKAHNFNNQRSRRYQSLDKPVESSLFKHGDLITEKMFSILKTISGYDLLVNGVEDDNLYHVSCRVYSFMASLLKLLFVIPQRYQVASILVEDITEPYQIFKLPSVKGFEERILFLINPKEFSKQAELKGAGFLSPRDNPEQTITDIVLGTAYLYCDILSIGEKNQALRKSMTEYISNKCFSNLKKSFVKFMELTSKVKTEEPIAQEI